ncbi:MAG: glycoside hydrolase family 5 protein [Thermomicrobiales bacterium]|nr:glycoside hydrolase family 5 protein [Thermomicrobiales bacterium]
MQLPVRLIDGVFRDANGERVFLNGINASGQAGKEQVIGRADLEQISSWGLNAIRYVVYWSDIEPAPGIYSETKLAEIETVLTWCAELDILMLLDMHQDLYHMPPGGGMPTWTVIEPDLPHITGGQNWSGAYFLSPLIQTAFDHFWANTAGSDGIGTQDRFATMWQMVVNRVKDAPALVGYDLLNEPFPGSAVMPALAAGTLDMLNAVEAAPPIDDPFELGMWAFATASADPELFDVWSAAVSPLLAALDESLLRPCYQRVTEAIRQVDDTTAILFEPFITANSGVIPQSLRWNDDLKLVFAPHIYEADPDRAEIITRQLLALAARERMPLVVGEWGNLDNADDMYVGDALAGARVIKAIVDANAAGRFYWAYGDGLAKQPFFAEMVQR